jgi:hypothetical protein
MTVVEPRRLRFWYTREVDVVPEGYTFTARGLYNENPAKAPAKHVTKMVSMLVATECDEVTGDWREHVERISKSRGFLGFLRIEEEGREYSVTEYLSDHT